MTSSGPASAKISQFANLHVHTDYSLLDGASRMNELVLEATALGQPAVATTDHGNLGGVYDLVRAAKAAGIKPIAGIEVYHAPGQRTDKRPIYWGTPEQKGSDVSGAGAYTHLTLLARNSTGLRNLYRMHNAAYQEGFYRKPRVDLELLERYGEGVICLSGCMGGAVATRLRLGQIEEAEATTHRLARLFPDSFFIEVMSHGFEEEEEVKHSLISLAHRLNLPMVATNDSHYTRESDAPVQKALLHLQTFGAFGGFSGSGYHLRSREEMDALGLPAEALDNTVKIAEMVEDYDDVFTRRVRMPVCTNLGFGPNDERLTPEEALTGEAYDGLNTRLNERGRTPENYQEYLARLQYEIDVINELGYPSYFLVLADIIRYAKARGIRVGPGRGSAGGSLVAWALRITDLDPLVHDLVFERFLNPQRASIPDIDIDVEDSRREEVRKYVLDTHGFEYVAMIGTYGVIGAKRALEDAARVKGIKRAVADRMKAKLPPARFGRMPGLSDGDWADNTPEEDDVLSLAVQLEGLRRNTGQHAAGLLISPEPIVEVVPVRKAAGGKENAETSAWEGLVTEFPMGPVDALGLVKYDFLGLRNLDIISKTMSYIGKEIPLPTNPEECDDTRTYQLLRAGNTTGVFQLDGSGMRSLLRAVEPNSFADIAAVLALYRPGPMGANSHKEYAQRKNRRVDIKEIHPELDLGDILDSTYGLIVYQEQVLAALKKVCGWSYAEADLLFNAMRKKDHAKLNAAKPGFFEAAQAHGTSQEAASALWDILVPFADYSFNRAHSAGYGLVAYWTAYLKANYPHEYMAALLGSVSSDPTKLQEYLDECRRIGIRLLPPDVNGSDTGFTPSSEGIRYGLSAIKGVGEKATAALLKRRPYADLPAFFRRADAKVLNIGVLRALVKAGALDSLHSKRTELLNDIDRLAELAARERDNRGSSLFSYGYTPRFHGADLHTDIEAWEQEVLGCKLSRPKKIIDVQTPKTQSEWAYIRSALAVGSDIEYELRFKGQLVSKGVCTLTPAVQSTLRDLGVEL